MDQGYEYFDIIIYAMVAGFLVLRLRSVLGRRTEDEANRPAQYQRQEPVHESNDNVVDLPGLRRDGPEDEADGPPSLASGLTHIRLADPSFEPNGFLQGAKAAFSMIIDAYARGDAETLRPLLADAVYENFELAINERKEAGETLETDIRSMSSIDLEEAEMRGSMAYVTVRYVTQQTNVLRDSDGEILEGDPDDAVEVIDLWTFGRDTTNDNPNWELMATKVPEESQDDDEGDADSASDDS
ncbi:MAG: Tim44/TimA family putative adaptor protein [Rhodospirillaceae bacterium]